MVPKKEVYHWEEEEQEEDDDDSDDGTPPYWDVPTPTDDQLTVRYHFRH